MKLFKNLTLYLSCILFLGPIEIFAAEETKYIASMSGVECTACKKTIAKAIAKLNGVKTIRIVKEGKKKPST